LKATAAKVAAPVPPRQYHLPTCTAPATTREATVTTLMAMVAFLEATGANG